MTRLPPIAVFDLDGTLAETAGDLVATLNAVMAREGLPAVPFEAARDMIGAGARALIERGFQAAGRSLEQAQLDELFAFFLAHYEEHILVHSHLFEGVEQALQVLSGDGFRLAVCTNKTEAHAVKLLGLLGVAKRFPVITGKDTFPFFKPDPRHLTETIRLAGGDPARAVMVGDSRTDIDTAKAAGVPVVAVTFGYTTVPVDQLGPDRIIAHFRELPAAVRDLVRLAA
ncbi:MAG: phosphoglycolate phosphatase [Beijerinckiaceae bacterium]